MLWALFSIAILFLLVIVFLLVQNNKYSRQSKQTSSELKSVENIVAHTNDALFVIEIADGKVLHVNIASAQLLGYSEKELLSKKYFDLMPKHLMNRSAEIIADVWEKKGLVFSDIPHQHKNGEFIPVECSAKVGTFDEQAAVVIYARDIRERLKYENEIKQINLELNHKNKEITDSIRYAQRIQQAILPHEDESQKLLPDHFVLFKPKDIVSGDFYLIDSIVSNDGDTLAGFAVVDCTGHGVPGAFMSLLGHSFFKQSMRDENVNSPAEALDFVNKNLVHALRYKQQASIRDGMDASFCVLNQSTSQIFFSGANNSAIIISDKILQEIKPDKRSIGQEYDAGLRFVNHTVNLKKGDMVYLFSDGYADQFGGPSGKKFKYKQLEELLVSICDLPVNEQHKILNDKFEAWKSSLEQVDDVTIIGVRI